MGLGTWQVQIGLTLSISQNSYISMFKILNILNSQCFIILIGKSQPKKTKQSSNFQVPGSHLPYPAVPGGAFRRRSKIWRKRWPVPSTTCGRMWGNSRQDATSGEVQGFSGNAKMVTKMIQDMDRYGSLWSCGTDLFSLKRSCQTTSWDGYLAYHFDS